MDRKNNHYLKKLIILDDDDKMVVFTFPFEDRKITCSRTMLCEVSAVFKTMFSEKWNPENSTVELNDMVSFDQFDTFKLFVEILYGMNHLQSISAIDACNVFFYCHKYNVTDISNDIVRMVNWRMLCFPVKVNELEIFIKFTQNYQLQNLTESLDKATLDLNESDAVKFFELAINSGMRSLLQQITEYMKTIPPSSDWSKGALEETVKSLQVELNELKAETKNLKAAQQAQQKTPRKTQKERTLNNSVKKGKTRINKTINIFSV